MIDTMNIEPIAYFRSPLTSKFGVPRQSNIVSELPGRIEITAQYANRDALRGLEEYDYLWLIWGFSEHVTAEKHATVRPPLLGGNERVGVWASRSPFRPNNLGLSAVRIKRVNHEKCTIDVLGGDLMDGTPIYDIKPYLAYADSHPEANGGFTTRRKWQQLEVVIPENTSDSFLPDDVEMLHQLLSLDPRPHYHADDGRHYVMPYKGLDIHFHVTDGKLYIDEITA